MADDTSPIGDAGARDNEYEAGSLSMVTPSRYMAVGALESRAEGAAATRRIHEPIAGEKASKAGPSMPTPAIGTVPLPPKCPVCLPCSNLRAPERRHCRVNIVYRQRLNGTTIELVKAKAIVSRFQMRCQGGRPLHLIDR